MHVLSFSFNNSDVCLAFMCVVCGSQKEIGRKQRDGQTTGVKYIYIYKERQTE
jgi:hypothetical protein